MNGLCLFGQLCYTKHTGERSFNNSVSKYISCAHYTVLITSRRLTEPSLDPQYVAERDRARLLSDAEAPAVQFQDSKNYADGDTIGIMPVSKSVRYLRGFSLKIGFARKLMQGVTFKLFVQDAVSALH